MSHVDVAVDVGSEGTVQLLFADVFQRRLLHLVRGVVDQDVQPAELLRRRVEELGARLPVAHVQPLDDALSSGGLYLPPRLLRVLVLLFRQVADGDVGALLGEADGHRPPDATVAAGDDGGQPLELAAALVAGLAVVCTGLQVLVGAGVRLIGLLAGRVGAGHRVAVQHIGKSPARVMDAMIFGARRRCRVRTGWEAGVNG
jgi:hypothetical protein